MPGWPPSSRRSGSLWVSAFGSDKTKCIRSPPARLLLPPAQSEYCGFKSPWIRGCGRTPRPNRRFNTANSSSRSSVGRSAQGPMDRPSFLLFVRAVLPVKAPEARFWRAPEVGGQVLTKTSCSPRLHCAEWWCVVLSDWPPHHNGSGRDWPYKSATRTKAGFRSNGGFFGPLFRIARDPPGAVDGTSESSVNPWRLLMGDLPHAFLPSATRALPGSRSVATRISPAEVLSDIVS